MFRNKDCLWRIFIRIVQFDQSIVRTLLRGKISWIRNSIIGFTRRRIFFHPRYVTFRQKMTCFHAYRIHLMLCGQLRCETRKSQMILFGKILKYWSIDILIKLYDGTFQLLNAKDSNTEAHVIRDRLQFRFVNDTTSKTHFTISCSQIMLLEIVLRSIYNFTN